MSSREEVGKKVVRISRALLTAKCVPAKCQVFWERGCLYRIGMSKLVKERVAFGTNIIVRLATRVTRIQYSLLYFHACSVLTKQVRKSELCKRTCKADGEVVVGEKDPLRFPFSSRRNVDEILLRKYMGSFLYHCCP